MEGERPSEKPKATLRNELKVVMKWIELVNKERKNSNPITFSSFLDFLQVRYDMEELHFINDYLDKNFDTGFNEEVLLSLFTPEQQTRTKKHKHITQSFLLLTGGSPTIQTKRLLEILNTYSPAPNLNDRVTQAIEKVEVKGMVDINRLVEYLI